MTAGSRLPLAVRRVVAVGGGHGLAATLGALRLAGLETTAIVTMADDGGSSGRLRRDLGLPPVGDLRMALLALSEPTSEAHDLFAYRFGRGELAGHSLGNLILAALDEIDHGLLPALTAAERWLGARGRVLPSTLAPVELCALVDGGEIRGQAALTSVTGRIEKVWLDPADPPAVDAVVGAVDAADLVLLGPGSTFTSIVPNLLVPGLGGAIARASARVVYICNLESGDGETAGFAPEAHLAALLAHRRGLEIPRVLLADAASPAAQERSDAFRALGADAIFADIADPRRPGRHDPERLAAALTGLFADGTAPGAPAPA